MTTTPKVAPVGSLALEYVRVMATPVTADTTTEEWESAIADLHSLMARAESLTADNARLRAALADAEVACDQAAEFLSGEPCTGAWSTAHAESLSLVAMEARAALTAHGAQEGGGK